MKNVSLHRRIASPFLLSESGEILQQSVVDFAEDGTVLAVRHGVENIDSWPQAEYYNGILIPGMVNSHCHLELSFFEGRIPQGTGLVEFVKHVVRERSNFALQQQVDDANRGDRYMWSQGIQAVGDISNGTVSYEAKVKSHIYYHTFAEYFGTPKPEQAKAQYDADTTNVARGIELGLAVTPTPHSTYLVSDALFKMANDSERLSIHFMETPSEIDLFDRRGGMYDFMMKGGMEPDFLQYGSHSKRLVESLPSHVPLLLVHNTQIKREDVELITSYFKDVTFVLCPRSNYYIERGFPPAVMLRDMGCRVALGTDSLSSNTSLSMTAEIEWLAKNNPSLELSTILSWATQGGASALGVGDKIGKLKVGYRPGAVVLEGVDFQTMRPTEQLKATRIL